MDTHREKSTIIKEKFKSVGSSSLDSKKRITLGNKIMKEIPLKHMEVDKFEIFVGEEGNILLKPMAHIHSRELWIYQNPKVLSRIQKGLRDAQEGKLKK